MEDCPRVRPMQGAKGEREIGAGSPSRAAPPLGATWKLLKQGQELMSMPRLAVIRTWVLNHTIHHRAHLCVYLRVNDVPVPGMYGPSADEGGM